MDCTCRVLSHGYWITESSLMLLGHVHSWSAVQVSPYPGWWSLRPSFTKHRFQILWNAPGLLKIHTFFYLTEIPFFVYKPCSFWYLHCVFPSQISKDLMVRATSTVHLFTACLSFSSLRYEYFYVTGNEDNGKLWIPWIYKLSWRHGTIQP